MNPNVPTPMDITNINLRLTQIDYQLHRIAHALEAIAKQNVPNFKTIAETPRQKR